MFRCLQFLPNQTLPILTAVFRCCSQFLHATVFTKSGTAYSDGSFSLFSVPAGDSVHQIGHRLFWLKFFVVVLRSCTRQYSPNQALPILTAVFRCSQFLQATVFVESDTAYSDWSFSSFFSVPTRKCRSCFDQIRHRKVPVAVYLIQYVGPVTIQHFDVKCCVEILTLTTWTTKLRFIHDICKFDVEHPRCTFCNICSNKIYKFDKCAFSHSI